MKATDPSTKQQALSPGFNPISIADYVKLHIANNPGTDAAYLSESLHHVLKKKLAGRVCQCGEPVWVIGSVQVGIGCFTCITGEAMPENEYEVVAADAEGVKSKKKAMDATEEMELLDDVLDGLDRLFDRESDVNDVFALIVATSHALANTCHSKVLSDATRGLELVVRKGASKEEARDEALQVTDQLRHYLADLSPF